METHDQTNGTATTTPSNDGPKCLLHGKGCKNEGTPPLVYVTIDGEQHPIHGVPREKGLKSCVQVLEETILAKDENGLPKLRDAEGNPLYRLGHGGNVRFDSSPELQAIQKKNREKAHKRDLKKESEGLQIGAVQFLMGRKDSGNTVLKDKLAEAGFNGSEAPKEEPKPVKKDWLGRPIAD